MPNNIVTILLAYGITIFSGIYALLVLIYAFFRSGPFMDTYPRALFLSAGMTFMLGLFLYYLSNNSYFNSSNSLLTLWAGLLLPVWLASSWFFGGSPALIFTAAVLSCAVIIFVIASSLL